MLRKKEFVPWSYGTTGPHKLETRQYSEIPERSSCIGALVGSRVGDKRASAKGKL